MAFSAQMHLHSYGSLALRKNVTYSPARNLQGGSFNSPIVSFSKKHPVIGSRFFESFFPVGSFNREPAPKVSVRSFPEAISAESGGSGDEGTGGRDGGDGDDSGDHFPEGGDANNRTEAMIVLATLSKTLSDLPPDLAKAVQQGRIPGSIIRRFFELEKVPFFRWLLQFGGMKERLLADDLFMTKVAIECGVGTITKTAAELERRRENFSKELDFVIADVMMAIIADFMLVFLPAPTVPLGSLVSKQPGIFANIFRGCPDNAFQVALAGTSYSVAQRFGAIVRNGGKLFCVATSASIIGTSATNLLIYLRKVFNKNYAGSSEDVPILSMSVAYGAYAAVSSNLRYQFLAGVVEQRILQPMLENQKLALSAICFVVRTGNTFLGSLMWVDYARWIGVQKIKDSEATE
ncbi:hypothetical protein KP509_13G039500 [Ceratopteris richardii]|uniref:Protein RETICULATA-RELATED 4, chloroplastic-like n=1 Tax=Ceratopteris richardii TaxID=49495 RepID=A0A8T2TF43_CERRI|nr:hypothetical protein KP509_13G039500 [Ceratopteris richardii]